MVERRKSARTAAKRALELTDLLSSDSENDVDSGPDHVPDQESGADSGNDDESEPEPDHASDHDHEEEPRSRPAKRARRAAAPRPETEIPESLLYRALSSVDVDVSDLALEWIEAYAEDQLHDDNKALTELFNLVLRCCGCVQLVQKHDMINSDSAPATVEELCVLFEKQRYHEYPFVSTNKAIKFFRKNVTDFFDSLVLVSHEKGMLYLEDSTSSSLSSPMMNDILAWMTALSSSNARPFRYVATSILLTLQTTLCEQSVSLIVSLEKQQRQLDSAKNSKARNQRAQQRKIDLISESINKFSRQCDTIAEYLGDLFLNVFVRRYKDIDTGIRTECVKSLGQWMIIYEENYVQAKYLRYLGWLLSDPNEHVRGEVVKSLNKLYKHVTSRSESMSMGFRQFTERFKKQFINMLWKEQHVSIKVQLFGLYHEIYKLGFLTDADVFDIGLYGFYLAETASKQDKVKFEWGNLAKMICTDKLQKELEKYTVFLSSHTSNLFGDEDDQLQLTECFAFKCLADLFSASFSNYTTSKRHTVSMLKQTLSFHEMVILLFSTMYSLPEIHDSWRFLIRYILCDVSAANFEAESSTEGDLYLTQEDDLKERIEISSLSERVLFLSFVAGAFEHIVSKKPSRRQEDTDSPDNMNVALPMLAPYLPELEKFLSKSSKLYVVFMSLWNTILIPLSRSLGTIYNNSNNVEEYNAIHESILQFYIEADTLDDDLAKVFDDYYALLLKNFESERGTEHESSDSDTVLNTFILVKIEDLLATITAEAITSLDSKEMFEDFDNGEDETILPEDQKVLCSRLIKSTPALLKLTQLARMINVNKYIAEPILNYDLSLLQCIGTKFLSKIDYISLIKLWPNNYLQILNQIQQSWETTLDLILLSLCWKLEELMYASGEPSNDLINIELLLNDFQENFDYVCGTFQAVQSAYKDLNESSLESAKSTKGLVESLVKLSSTLAAHIIDGIVSLRVFYYKLKGTESFQNLDAYFLSDEGVGKFVNGAIPVDLQSALMNVFLIDETQMAKLLSVDLEREENEDVNYEDFCFQTPIVMEVPVPIEPTEFGGSDDEDDDDFLVRVDPRVEEEANAAEAAARELSQQNSAHWELERKFLVYVVKIMSLVKTEGFSNDAKERLALNALVLGESFQKIIKEVNLTGHSEIDEMVE